MKEINILWIRHCESCSNIAMSPKFLTLSLEKRIERKFFIQPLCTETGLLQAIQLGYTLKNFAPNLPKTFLSSTLPRAALTAKLLTIPTNKRGEIQRIPYINEAENFTEVIRDKLHIGKQSPNRTSLTASNMYVKAINKIFPVGKKNFSQGYLSKNEDYT